MTEFEWDLDRARTNLAKHCVDFEDACHAVLDPLRIEDIDDRFDYGEERIRIISARPANASESKRYFGGA